MINVSSLKELEQLMRLCRKQGVRTFKLDNIEFTLEDQPVKPQRRTHVATQEASQDTGVFDPMQGWQVPITPPPDLIPTNAPTEEQLLYGSSDPSVWDDPKSEGKA